MKRPLVLLSLIWFLPFGLLAQDLNGPNEILRIMQQSSLQFKILELNTRIAEPPVHELRNGPTLYSEIIDGHPGIGQYEVDAANLVLFEEAEADYAAGRYPAAKAKYLQLHEAQPDLAMITTYIGQCYFEEGHRKEAIGWYREAIQQNYHGYMAHWYLADNLFALGELKEAVQEITIAWVLNRNSEDVLSSLIPIYKADHRQFEDFTFSPNYAMELEEDTLKIRYSENWMMYAFCKALWAYEPGYHRELGGGRAEFDFVQERECLANLMADYDRLHGRKKSKDLAINALFAAHEKQSVNDFIFMELWLPIEPAIIYAQPKLAVDDLVDYVLQVRCPKK